MSSLFMTPEVYRYLHCPDVKVVVLFHEETTYDVRP